MSSSRLPQGNDFTLPHRTVLDTHRSVYPSNRNRPDLKNQGLWTNKQYREIDHLVRDTIEDIFEVVTGGTHHESGKQEPDNIPGEATSYTKLIKILHEAKEHHSKTVRCNLAAVASGLDTGSGWIDDGQYHTESCQDPELDVDGARDSKFCIVETIREEAEKLATKEFESVMYCLEIVLGGMRELVRCWRLRNGWDDRMMQFGHPHQGHVPQHVNVPEHVEGGSR
ncbi:hypothetical protein BKA61DRAFT_620685 [Leptodontidium sp. MPI-SDFR-AT-0119]|nr:hypothetical protein BKA61DRAFT_620685 [Leptodontidium sp. MPI-SDFR-AT-0119]